MCEISHGVNSHRVIFHILFSARRKRAFDVSVRQGFLAGDGGVVDWHTGLALVLACAAVAFLYLIARRLDQIVDILRKR
jgi:hypothetical protein